MITGSMEAIIALKEKAETYDRIVGAGGLLELERKAREYEILVKSMRQGAHEARKQAVIAGMMSMDTLANDLNKAAYGLESMLRICEIHDFPLPENLEEHEQWARA